MNGKRYPARRATPAERARRDKLIRWALEAGITQEEIAQHLGISAGTVARIAATVKRRRRRSRQSRHYWG
ncbi:hypothetical protein ABW17_12090 [Mycobacterium nebraskense]|nr:hypothetical protein ABW17_12090 [Mycobacterium nebraskense]